VAGVNFRQNKVTCEGSKIEGLWLDLKEPMQSKQPSSRAKRSALNIPTPFVLHLGENDLRETQCVNVTGTSWTARLVAKPEG